MLCAQVFCAELPIFLREHRNGMYRTDVYFICKTLAEAPIFLAIPLLFTAIAYPMIGLYPDVKHFFIAAAIVALVANVSTSFGNLTIFKKYHRQFLQTSSSSIQSPLVLLLTGYLISCISNGVAMALSVGPPVIIPFLLFGGFFLNTA